MHPFNTLDQSAQFAADHRSRLHTSALGWRRSRRATRSSRLRHDDST